LQFRAGANRGKIKKMFIHAVIFKIASSQVAKYRKDSLMWAQYARKAGGFIAYFTMKRYGYNGEYVSVYEWKSKAYHDRFMKKYHDYLVLKSRAKVMPLAYYNLKMLDNLKNLVDKSGKMGII